MRVNESCAKCLYDRQANLSEDEGFRREIREIIDGRKETDTAPYLVYLFHQVQEKYLGKTQSYAAIKRKYNDLVLGMEDALRREIENADDPLERAFAFARVGNFIDFGAMNDVDEKQFLALFDGAGLREDERAVWDSFLNQCARAKRFLLCADNCGEIVLDRLLIEQMKRRFPGIEVSVLVRGGEALNDATAEDALYVGLDNAARIISNGAPVAGTVYDMLTGEAKTAINTADVILAKGQGNYESMSGQGRHVFYAFLCKCELFTGRFGVPLYTGMFVEEGAAAQGE